MCIFFGFVIYTPLKPQPRNQAVDVHLCRVCAAEFLPSTAAVQLLGDDKYYICDGQTLAASCVFESASYLECPQLTLDLADCLRANGCSFDILMETTKSTPNTPKYTLQPAIKPKRVFFNIRMISEANINNFLLSSV